MDEQTTYAPPTPPASPPGPTTQAPAPGDGRSGRLTAGVVLIVLGVLFLAGRFFPGFQWWGLWPLIIIVAGLVQAFSPGRDGWSVARMFDGFVTVAFGAVFLAITSGAVGWGVWARIIEFWPVLLISLGLELLGKSLHASWPKVLGSLVVIGALAFSVVTYAGGVGRGGGWMRPMTAGEPFSYSAPVGSVEEAKLALDAGVARVALRPGRNLVAVEGRTDGRRPSVAVSGDGKVADVAVDLGGPDGAVMWPGDSPSFDVWISDAVTWDLRLSTGVSELTADLSSVPVSTLDLRPGVASCEVRLGDVPAGVEMARATVKAGISSVRVEVPQGTEARIEIESGLSGQTVGEDFEDMGGGVWETPGFAAARQSGAGVWVISVRSGIGSIDIDTY